MPSLSSSSSVFGRFRRHTQDPTSPPSLTSTTSPPNVPTITEESGSPTEESHPVPETETSRFLHGHGHGHKRESSILSISNSVNDIRRSVSLRSHRSQPSVSSHGHRSRLSAAYTPSSRSTDGEPVPISPSRRDRSRNKLSVSINHIGRQTKSTDNLHVLSPAPLEGAPAVPPLSAVDTGSKHNPFSMLASGAPPFRRHASERPSLGGQTSLSRDTVNGPSLQPAAPLQHVASNGQNPSAVYQQIRETASKRIATIEYLKRVHEGDVYYFSTLHYTPANLSTLPSMHPLKLGRRSTSYLLLGYSLPALLELNSGTPLEYLKALSALLQEFETYQNLAGVDTTGSSLSRGRVGQIFKSGMGLGKGAGKGRRASGTPDSIALDASMMGMPGGMASPPETPMPVNPVGHDFQHLLTPNLPFDPDFGITFATLCDTLVETYTNLLALIPNPELCSAAVGDAFVKADKSIRKILVANVMREFEDNSRANIKTEVAGLGRLVLGGLM